MKAPTHLRVLIALLVLSPLAACSDSPTAPPSGSEAGLSADAPSLARGALSVSDEMPTGERIVGRAAIEPAYDADTGEFIYLLTPIKAPFPAKANSHAVSPLYMVEYPATSSVDVPLNCMGVPGNCPDHNGLAASVATDAMPSVYGTDPTAVPGHDHVADSQGAPDFNIAWEVIEVLFTSADAANQHLTTEAQIEAAVAAGDAIEIDLGIAFNCNVVPASLYWRGAPVG